KCIGIDDQKYQKLKIKSKERAQYKKGAIVEVRSEEAYTGSWYCARILNVLADDKDIVEHLRFSRDGDESIPLRDLVEAQNIRPVPPSQLSPVARYEPGDEVDAWFNKRWWISRVSKVLARGSMYLVYFISTGEELTVLHFNLRPGKEWINGRWINSYKENASNLHRRRYTVIRLMVLCKDYKLLRGKQIHKDVEAWFNDGWWSGRVYKINNNYMRYGVYFKTTDERLEFAYTDLRPCKVWRKGKWSRA
ncbi:hypothetical protein EUTSA_v10027168mg, partial [Eutrema salsugineum]